MMKARLRKKMLTTVFDADRQFFSRMTSCRGGEAGLRQQYSIVVKHRKQGIKIKIELTRKRQ